jgi:hypothetical protein
LSGSWWDGTGAALVQRAAWCIPCGHEAFAAAAHDDQDDDGAEVAETPEDDDDYEWDEGGGC